MRTETPGASTDRPLRPKADVVIVGGGIVGITLAYYLTRKGLCPLVLDRETIGRGASSANPGTISLITKQPGLALEMARRSICQFDVLASELADGFDYERLASVVIAENSREIDYLASLTSAQQAAGVESRMVDEQRLRAICPVIEGPVVGGSYFQGDGQVNPFLLLAGLARMAVNGGATVMTGVRLDAVETARDAITGVVTSRGRVATDWVVNAAGAWGDEIGRMVGCVHGITPTRGQMMVLRAPADFPMVKITTAASLLAKHQATTSDSYSLGIAPKPKSRTVLVGGSREDVGFDKNTTSVGLGRIARIAQRLTPSLGELPVIRTWAGIRPSRAGGPLIGDGGGPRGYLAAVGHGGDGVALAPVTAEFLTEVVWSGTQALSMKEWLTAGA